MHISLGMLKPLTGLEGWLLAHLNGDKPFTKICHILSWMEGLDIAIFPFQLLCTCQIFSEPVRSWIRSSFHFGSTDLIVFQSVTDIFCSWVQPILWLHDIITRLLYFTKPKIFNTTNIFCTCGLSVYFKSVTSKTFSCGPRSKETLICNLTRVAPGQFHNQI